MEFRNSPGISLSVMYVERESSHNRPVNDTEKRRIGIEKWMDEVVRADPVWLQRATNLVC